MVRRVSRQEKVIRILDNALRTVWAPASAERQPPKVEGVEVADADVKMTSEDRRSAAALMRVNHAGEICAQALYTGQSAATNDEKLKAHLQEAADEEVDHLAWTEQRIQELGSHTSYLNPFWYAGAFAIGYAAAKLGDDWSLGFVEETEKQVEAHLDGHLSKLPEHDVRSRSIVRAMRDDEIAHAQQAHALGARRLPVPIRLAMKASAKVMTTLAAKV